MKQFAYILAACSCLLATSCHSKDSAAIRRPFCHLYNFIIRGDTFQLSLLRDTSGGFPTYAGTVSGVAMPGFIYINTEATDSARPDALKFDFYGSGQNAFNFSGTVSPDGSTIDGFVKMQQPTTPADSIRCTMQQGAAQPLRFCGITKRIPARGDSTMINEFSVKLFWPEAGIPAIIAMRYKKDVEELLKIKVDSNHYSAGEYLKKYEADFIESNVNLDTDVPPVYSWEENWANLIYANKQWMTFQFHKLWYTSIMPHHQWDNYYFMYDMRTGQHLKLSNFFTREALQKIPALLEKYFRLNRGLKPREPLTKAGLYDNYIRPNNNYCITGEALHFHYGNYEIAPFYAGEFDVAIPLSEFGNDFRYQPN